MDKDYSELVEYLDGKFGEVNARIDKLEARMNQLVDSIDKLVKSVENLKDEYIAITSKVDAHEKWIKQASEKLGIKLEY